MKSVSFLLITFISLFFILGVNKDSKAQRVKKGFGTIKGEVGYPSEYMPTMIVCAESVLDSTIKYTLEVKGNNIGSSKYTFNLPEGVYYVYAIPTTEGNTFYHRAYYTDNCLCGFHVRCYEPSGKRSVLLKVFVEENKTKENINPEDWYWDELLIIGKDSIRIIYGGIGKVSNFIIPKQKD